MRFIHIIFAEDYCSGHYVLRGQMQVSGYTCLNSTFIYLRIKRLGLCTVDTSYAYSSNDSHAFATRWASYIKEHIPSFWFGEQSNMKSLTLNENTLFNIQREELKGRCISNGGAERPPGGQLLLCIKNTAMLWWMMIRLYYRAAAGRPFHWRRIQQPRSRTEGTER